MNRQMFPQSCGHTHIHGSRIIFSYKRQIPVESRSEAHTSEHTVIQLVHFTRITHIPGTHLKQTSAQSETFCQNAIITLVVIVAQVGKRVVRTYSQSREEASFLQYPESYRHRPVLLVELRLVCHIRSFQQSAPVIKFEERKKSDTGKIVSGIISERNHIFRQIITSNHKSTRFIHYGRRRIQHTRSTHAILSFSIYLTETQHKKHRKKSVRVPCVIIPYKVKNTIHKIPVT